MFRRSKKKKTQEPPFWKLKSLREMNREEWECLCDGCGRCCLNKLEHELTGEILYTDVACRLLDPDTCRCANYENRKRFVPECQTLTPRLVDKLGWLPSTCAYRLLSEGQELYWWHPLVSGDPETVHYAGISVRGRVVSERDTNDLENRVVGWPK
ncbi:MAG: YcgN family cysteine cluster protein [Rhodospirillaceae bacterium]